MHSSSRGTRWPALPAFFFAAPALAGALLLTACGGGGGSSSNPPQADVPSPARTAPTIPVARQSAYAASGAGSYQEALQNYNRVGEVLHGQ